MFFASERRASVVCSSNVYSQNRAETRPKFLQEQTFDQARKKFSACKRSSSKTVTDQSPHTIYIARRCVASSPALKIFTANDRVSIASKNF